jgi:sialate O-acetylesterase
MKPQVFILFVLVWLGISLSARADNRLARVFQDNMVLQQQKPVPVWGWADPATQVEVDFAGQSKQATADEKGYWKAILDPLTANGTGQDLTAKIGATSVTCKNVLVGEVWICAGPSGTTAEGPNIDTGVYPHYVSQGTAGGKPEVRVFTVFNGTSMEPWPDFDPVFQGQGDAHWRTLKENAGPDDDTVMRNSMEYCARIMRDKLNVPVAVIHLITVGVLLPDWFSKETLEALPSDVGTGNCFDYLFNLENAHLAKGNGPIKSWDDLQKAMDDWKANPKGGQPFDFAFPTVAYNTRLYPLAPFAIRGFRLFSPPVPGTDGAAGIVAMVKQWRQLFGQDFYFVNCTNIRLRTSDQPPLKPGMYFWDQGTKAIFDSLPLFGDDAKLEGLVDFTDLSSWQAHHCQRAEEGRRLASTILALAYGQPLAADGAGPRAADMKIEGNKATIRFDQVGDGIVYQPSIDGISGVYLRGKSGPGQWAQVNVVGKDTIELSSPDISELDIVAYGQATNAHETLFSSGGLPAAPFILNPPKGNAGPPDPQPPYRMVDLVGSTGWDHVFNNDAIKNAHISLVHVRRTGYVFQVNGQETLDVNMKQVAGAGQSDEQLANSSATAPMQAYIPAEWDGYEVVTGDKCELPFIGGSPVFKGIVKTGGKVLPTTETTHDGAKFVTFDGPVDGTWIIVAQKGKAVDFAKVNRY